MSWDSHERRQFVRISLPLKIYLSGSPNNISAKTRNISAGGLRIIIKHKFSSGSIVNLKIYTIKRKPILCQGKILWVFSRKNIQSKDLFYYDTGIEFYKIKKNSLDVIKKIIAKDLARK
ncbi:MAG: PilZ domain-containing protein [Candidatus Omnitrophica bacterium]|nr:PilZ domain-containing protein [Candidatus Omnitrophota bacterium]MCF7894367.1 PilZ domain-containing protein [Candidatus Omnitrophota bacterium]